MASGRSSKGAGGAASSSTDVSQHPGFVNLGNTCFLNSALQAISATQALKQLYLPSAEDQQRAAEQQWDFAEASSYDAPTPTATQKQQLRSGTSTPAAAPSSRRASLASDLLQARCKSPVLRLADEEHGRHFAKQASASEAEPHSSMEASISAIAQQAVANPTPADMQTIRSAAAKAVNGNSGYSPTASDLPLNTAFRQVLERSWQGSAGAVNRKVSLASSSSSSSKHNTPAKVVSINPKPLLNEISAKYDQYSEYRQQDGHELLRHLLDSLRMEELDVIKKIRPPLPPSKRRRKPPSERPVGVSFNNESAATGNHAAALDDQLKPLVDNLFCGKLLSFVVCEGCRHVSHTYEDFYDISLSLRPDVDAKESGKRQRIRSMADRWRRSATSANKSTSASDLAKPLVESLTMLREGGQSGSYSDTEQIADEPIHRSSSRVGRSISRPRSAADRARIDANSKEGAKTFIKRQMERQQIEGDATVAPEKALESMTLTPAPEKRRDLPGAGSAVSLLRAVSGRRTPSGNSPLRRDGTGEGTTDAANHDTHTPQRHGHDIGHHFGHQKKPSRSKHTQYIAKLLAEAPVAPPQQANLGALLWGRRTPVSSAADTTPATQSPDAHAAGASKKHEVDIEAQQANTGLVRALYQFTGVEVLDGANSFACKRCWRLLNPPSAAENEKLRLRRLRRGKAEDESERSSDDDSSSDEEAKENRQRFALSEQRKKKNEERQLKKQQRAQNLTALPDKLLLKENLADSAGSSLNGSSVSSLVSLSDGIETDQSRRQSMESAAEGPVASVAPSESAHDDEKMPNGRPAPAVIVVPSEVSEEGVETPKRSLTFSKDDVPLSVLKASDLMATKSNGSRQTPEASFVATRAPPLLKAPKPILASSVAMRLADTVSPGASSDEGESGGGVHSSIDDESDDDVIDEARIASRQRSIRYADDDEHASGVSGITKPANINLASSSVKPPGKRSANSLPRRALKRFLIAETPKVFVFHFKRFQATGRGFSFATSFKKIDDYISFPEYLDVRPWLAPPREEYDRHGNLKASSDARALLAHQRAREHDANERLRHAQNHHLWHRRWHHDKHLNEANEDEQMGGPRTRYRLYGVVVHQGSMSGGHYTAFVLSDRASESMKAKTANGAEPGSRKVSSASTTAVSDNAPWKGNDEQDNGSGRAVKTKSSNSALLASSLKSTKTEESSAATTASTPSPFAPSSSTRVEALSSVSSLGSNIGESGNNVATPVENTRKVQNPPPPRVDERRWIYASDTLVRAASIDEVLKAQAYMLFYEQM